MSEAEWELDQNAITRTVEIDGHQIFQIIRPNIVFPKRFYLLSDRKGRGNKWTVVGQMVGYSKKRILVKADEEAAKLAGLPLPKQEAIRELAKIAKEKALNEQ